MTRFLSSLLVSGMTLLLLLQQSTVVQADWKGPRDRFWRHHVETQTLVLNGVDYYPLMMDCLHQHLTPHEWNDIETVRADRNIGLKLRDDFRQSKVILVAVERAIAPLHVQAIQTLATCVRTLFPQLYEARSFYVELGFDEDNGLGGNNPTHLAPLVPIFFPAVAAEMQRTLELAYEAAGWSHYHPDQQQQQQQQQHQIHEDDLLPSPDQVGFRASEHLTYKDFKEGLADHTDGPETHFTINFAFSGPQDYDGGYFYIKYGEGDLWGGENVPKEQMLIKPNKYDCLVFLGGPYLHGVTAMTGGNREMFSSELWAFPDTPFGSTLWMNNADRMAEYIRRCNQEKLRNGNQSGPCQVDMNTILPNNNNNNNNNNGGPPDQMQEEPPENDNDDDEDEEEDGDDDLEDLDRRIDQRDEFTSMLSASSFWSRKEEPFFLVRKDLQPTESSFVYWREALEPVDRQRAMVVKTPYTLGRLLAEYLYHSGLYSTARDILINDAASYSSKTQSVHELPDDTQWNATRQARHGPNEDGMEPETDLIILEPRAPTNAHEMLEKILTQGDFEDVLEQVALRFHYDMVQVESVQILALTFAYDAGPTDFDVHDEGLDRFFLPILLPKDRPAMLGIGQRDVDTHVIEWGEMQMQTNLGVVVGRRTPYAAGDCDATNEQGLQVYLSVQLSGSAENSNSTASSSPYTLTWPAREDDPSCSSGESDETAEHTATQSLGGGGVSESNLSKDSSSSL